VNPGAKATVGRKRGEPSSGGASSFVGRLSLQRGEPSRGGPNGVRKERLALWGGGSGMDKSPDMWVVGWTRHRTCE
jgi:hypothetical protein